MDRKRRKKGEMGDPSKAVGLVRVSTARQDLSPEAQRGILADWCQARGIDLVDAREERVTGSVKAGNGSADVEEALHKRAGLLEALEAVRTTGAGVLLVQKRDRLARNVVAAVVIEEMARKAGAVVLTTEGESSDPDDPTAFLMRALKDAFAQYEAMMIALRTRTALAVKRGRGEWMGTPPFGYMPDPDLRGAGRKLVPCPGEQVVLQVARRLRGDGMSLPEIAAELGRLGYRTRAGRNVWAISVVANMVKDVPQATRNKGGRKAGFKLVRPATMTPAP